MRDELAVVADQTGAPTSAALVARVTGRFLERLASAPPAPGLYHLAPRGAVTWHGYAQAILEAGPDEVEMAYKRVPVSLAETPNHNPEVAGVRVDGLEVASGARVELDRGQTYQIEVVLAEGAVEVYTYRTEAGVDEERVEEPYFLWYAQEGSFDQTATLYPTVEVEYTTPAETERAEQSLWVVARDRRGGMGWAEVPIRLR